MKITLDIVSATVVTGSGPDYVYLGTKFPEPCYPFTGNLNLSFTVASGDGENYLMEHFPNVKTRVVGR